MTVDCQTSELEEVNKREIEKEKKKRKKKKKKGKKKREGRVVGHQTWARIITADTQRRSLAATIISPEPKYSFQ